MTVSCSGDKELRGDRVITCNQGTDFQFQLKPKCNDVGMYKLKIREEVYLQDTSSLHYSNLNAYLIIKRTIPKLYITPTFPGTCTELPAGLHLKTHSVFPVKKGDMVFVSCVEGFTLTSGDRMITCVQDAHYTSSGQLPTCIISEWIFL